jgi:hypothetical protein
VPVVAQFGAEAVLIGAAGAAAARFLPATRPAPAAARPPRRERVRAWSAGWGDPRLLLIGLLSQTLGAPTALWAVAALLAVGFAASGALRPRPSAPRS